MRNDVDPESSVMKQLVGYSVEGLGVEFNEQNTVTRITRGGMAELDDMLRIGDVVLTLDGKALKGAILTKLMNDNPMPAYVLTVARYKNADAKGKSLGAAQEGHLLSLKARNGTALALQWPKKAYFALEGKEFNVYEGRRRGAKPSRTYSLKGAECKTPVLGLKGQKLSQPPVIQNLLQQRKVRREGVRA